MKTICFYFQVHQPFRLRRYRFFDIGNDHHYYDDFTNRTIMRKIADKCYLPANKILLDLIKKHGDKFRISFSISGSALEQFEMYYPEVLESFQELAKTGCIEFLAETYSHSLAALRSTDEFKKQIELHSQKIEQHFGQKPKAFRNTEMIYSDNIGKTVADLGYELMLTEGAKHILAWKSPNYLYFNPINKKLKLLLRNYELSDDIAFRFSNKAWENWPLTAEKFAGWLNSITDNEEILNLFMDYETFGEHQWEETGIFEFLKALPSQVFEKTKFKFKTVSEAAKLHQPKAVLNVPYEISWADAERDLTAWLGNELQKEAFGKLYEMAEQVEQCENPAIKKDWQYLQASDHFYYMCTKFFSDGDVHTYFNPYNSPYEAFINYMNVLSDFKDRLQKIEKEKGELKTGVPKNLKKEEADKLIRQYEEKIRELKKNATISTNTNTDPVRQFKIDGRMTVKSLQKKFKDTFSLSLRVYSTKTAGRGAKKADAKDRLGQLAQQNGFKVSGALKILDEITIEEFEKKFKTKFGIAIQIADSNDEELVNNKLKLTEAATQ